MLDVAWIPGNVREKQRWTLKGSLQEWKDLKLRVDLLFMAK